MKAFAITCIIFTCLIIIIIVNFIYINNTADTLKELTEAILPYSDDLNTRIAELDSFWKNNLIKIEISVNHSIINNISANIESIKSYSESGEKALLAREIALLKEGILELRRLERFKVSNIF